MAIIGANPILFDPDLSTEGRKLARPRASFSMQVVKLLNNADLFTKSLAHRILQGLWPNAKDPAISGYDPRKKETWGFARAAWTEYLGK